MISSSPASASMITGPLGWKPSVTHFSAASTCWVSSTWAATAHTSTGVSTRFFWPDSIWVRSSRSMISLRMPSRRSMDRPTRVSYSSIFSPRERSRRIRRLPSTAARGDLSSWASTDRNSKRICRRSPASLRAARWTMACLLVRCTAAFSSSGLKGLARKSNAPTLVACTAVARVA